MDDQRTDREGGVKNPYSIQFGLLTALLSMTLTCAVIAHWSVSRERHHAQLKTDIALLRHEQLKVAHSSEWQGPRATEIGKELAAKQLQLDEMDGKQ
jgi:hypothetical protein